MAIYTPIKSIQFNDITPNRTVTLNLIKKNYEREWWFVTSKHNIICAGGVAAVVVV